MAEDATTLQAQIAVLRILVHRLWSSHLASRVKADPSIGDRWKEALLKETEDILMDDSLEDAEESDYIKARIRNRMPQELDRILGVARESP